MKSAVPMRDRLEYRGKMSPDGDMIRRHTTGAALPGPHGLRRYVVPDLTTYRACCTDEPLCPLSRREGASALPRSLSPSLAVRKALAHRFESPHASRRKCVVCLPAGLEALLELTLLIARHHHRELLNEQRPGA